MATNYTELKAEVQAWLDNDNPNVVASIPTFIADAEVMFDRRLRDLQQELWATIALSTDPNGIEYDLPSDWNGNRVVRIVQENLELLYLQKVPKLADPTPATNWVLDNHPDLYRYASLASAEGFVKHDRRIPMWASKTEALLQEITEDDQFNKLSGDDLVSRPFAERPWYKNNRFDKRLEYLRPLDFYELQISRYKRSDGPYSGYYTISNNNKLQIWPPYVATP